MAVYSGKGGSVIGYGDVGRWRLNMAASTTSVTQDDTGRWKASYVGALSASGEFEAFGHQHPSVGETVFLQLRTGERTYSGQAMIESIEIEVDIETGAPVRYRARFISHGQWN